MKYRKKPVVVEAVQFTWNNLKEVAEFVKPGEITIITEFSCGPVIQVPTLYGPAIMAEGEWLVRDDKGLYTEGPEDFEKSFEPVFAKQ